MGREIKSMGFFVATLRYILIVMNACLMLLSLIGVIVGILLEDQKNAEGYLRFCDPCKQFQMLIAITSAIFFLFSSIGFFALWKRKSFLLAIYSFFMFIFFVVSLTLTIVVFLLHEGKFDNRLKRSWESEAAENEDDSLCKFQYEMKCSGWDVQCPVTTPTFTWANYTIEEKHNCPDCTGTRYLSQINDRNVTSQTCHKVLRDDVDKYFDVMIGVGFALMFISFGGMMISCKVRMVYEETEEVQGAYEEIPDNTMSGGSVDPVPAPGSDRPYQKDKKQRPFTMGDSEADDTMKPFNQV